MEILFNVYVDSFNFFKVLEVAKKQLSQKHGKSRKRTRRESFLSDMIAMIQEQQRLSDHQFYKREDERQKMEQEEEKKRRKEESDHEMHMLQVMGNMFMQTAATLMQQPPHFYGPSTYSQYPFHSSRQQQQIPANQDEPVYTNVL